MTLPVGMYSATGEHTTHFHQLQRGTSDRVRIQRVNERTGKEVDYDDIVKGYDLGGRYVLVEPAELDAIAPGKSELLDVSGFVDEDDIAPVFYDRTYYLAPRGAPYAKVYTLLRTAMHDARKAGIATFVMRGKQYLVALRADEKVITAETLHWPDEVRDPGEQLDLPRRGKPPAPELRAARQLVDAMTIDWNPADWRDTYEAKVRALIDAKAEDGEIAEAEPAPKATDVVDIMDALRRSLERAGTPRDRAGRPAARSGRSPAPRSKAGSTGDRTGKSRRKGKAVTGKRPTKKAATGAGLSELSKQELYDRASRMKITGRSQMNRGELLDAVRAAS
ncbi:Ku protein [Yinghuangia sp. KLBMP8922]|uniref:Non-homologous end joining protein Ku n=1 Tax=Yinghuangia soli TaxID=2908204 RepID=A0AA41TZE4_9ACTN|nr:Ku protein [Yinghuangia soli]